MKRREKTIPSTFTAHMVYNIRFSYIPYQLLRSNPSLVQDTPSYPHPHNTFKRLGVEVTQRPDIRSRGSLQRRCRQTPRRAAMPPMTRRDATRVGVARLYAGEAMFSRLTSPTPLVLELRASRVRNKLSRSGGKYKYVLLHNFTVENDWFGVLQGFPQKLLLIRSRIKLKT